MEPYSNPLEFSTGTLHDVVRYQRPDRKREYRYLFGILAVTTIPYALLFALHPLVAVWIVSVVVLWKIFTTFAASMRTDTAHHIRFLLAGSNPIGMTGGSSMLLGAVDSLVDWCEDGVTRRRQPVRFWLTTVMKFLLTPLGVLMMLCEFTWDLLLLGSGRELIRHKWDEFFSLAYYHDWICPEKSNDIFYADMAVARSTSDPYYYQWNRMRAMVFELQHYRVDIHGGMGVPETNLFRQDDVTAFRTLKRLQLEQIEDALERHFGDRPKGFPVPVKIARRLVANARPIRHYLAFREELESWLSKRRPAWAAALHGLIHDRLASDTTCYLTWHVLCLLEQEPRRFAPDRSRYFPKETVGRLQAAGIIQQVRQLPRDEFSLTDGFRCEVEALLADHFQAASEAEANRVLHSRVPTVLRYRDQWYVLQAKA